MPLWSLLLQFDEPRRLTLFERYPGMRDTLILLAALALIAFMIYWVRGAKKATGFTIHVSEDDIAFTGDFPPAMQQTVIDFLAKDIAVPGPYRIRGHWESTSETGGNKILIIAVTGENGTPYEQRIRNFLKLNLKTPR